MSRREDSGRAVSSRVHALQDDTDHYVGNIWQFGLIMWCIAHSKSCNAVNESVITFHDDSHGAPTNG